MEQSDTFERLESEAMELTVEERAELAQRLFASLEGHETEASAADVEAAWLEEAERRYQRYVSGESRAVRAADALGRVRDAIRRK